MSKAREAISKQLIDTVKQAIDNGDKLPWQKPWTPIVPMNMNTLRPYNGFNRVWLQWLSSIKGFKSPYWLTPKQAMKAGGNFKGEKTTIVVYWKKTYQGVKDSELSDEEKRSKERNGEIFMYPIYHRVLNADQVSGIDVPKAVEKQAVGIENADKVFDAMPNPPVYVEAAGSRCYYTPRIDTVTMCLPEQFDTMEAYYAVKAHEYVHSTGHESRLNRPEITNLANNGMEPYSREELVAELGAAMLCAEIGIEPNVNNSTAYLQSWLKSLENDPMMLVVASNRADKAVSYILGEADTKEEKKAA